jgi:hypothetical protein
VYRIYELQYCLSENKSQICLLNVANCYERCKERFACLRSFAHNQSKLVFSGHKGPKEAFLEIFQIMYSSTSYHKVYLLLSLIQCHLWCYHKFYYLNKNRMNKRQLHLPLKRRRPTAGRLSIMEGAMDYQIYQEMSLVSESYSLSLTNK